jgi:hypothetical protein
MARLRVPVAIALIFGMFSACDGANSFNTDSSASAEPLVGGDAMSLAEPTITGDAAAAPATLSLASASFSSASFSGGIPIGIAALPTSQYGDRYNGALENFWPDALMSNLAAIKARGGKVVLMFAGNEQYYKNSDGSFSLTKWKQRVDRFRHVNFSSYVSDGTIVGHYLIDEPNDPANWNGHPVSPSTIDQMGQYSKGIWPNMPTLVRTEPSYFTSNPRYIDAAWAQYLARRGNVNDYIRRVVSDAQNRGLALVVGLNVLRGGSPNGTSMSSSEVKAYGSALLSSSYPCAFVSWKWASLLSTTSMKDAMDYLRTKAENRSAKSCRGS